MIKKVLQMVFPNPVMEQAEADWFAELRERYESFDQIAFQCPACNHVQTVKDAESGKQLAEKIYCECWNCQLTIDQMDGGRKIISEEGDEYRLFDFASVSKEGD